MSVKETMEKQIQHTQKTPLSSEERDDVFGKALSARMMCGQAPDEPCISLEEIAGFIDGSLTDVDKNRIMGHLSRCERCFQVFSMTSELQKPEPVSAGRQNRWYVISGAVAVAAVAVLVINFSVQSPSKPQQLAQKNASVVPQNVAVTIVPEASQKKSSSPSKSVLADTQLAHKSKSSGELQLLSPDEASEPGAKQFGFSGRASPDGPGITIESPVVVKQKEGITTLKIRFEPHKAENIDLNSFKLECLKQNPIDLTERIRPYANENGVQADRVKLPPGRHKFRISVADYKGRLSEKDFTILVSIED